MRANDSAGSGRLSVTGRPRRRYREWSALGAGGLPHNVAGWLCSEALGLFSREPISTSCYDDAVASASPSVVLPRRDGPRPQVAPFAIPHRQVNQLADNGSRERLRRVFDDAVERHAPAVVYRQSFYERHHDAIALAGWEGAAAHIRRGRGELAHIHPSDGSMHMVFSEATAVAVLDAGWGQRHPLAGVPMKLPLTYLLIYPPRNADELATIERILAACIVDAVSQA